MHKLFCWLFGHKWHLPPGVAVQACRRCGKTQPPPTDILELWDYRGRENSNRYCVSCGVVIGGLQTYTMVRRDGTKLYPLDRGCFLYEMTLDEQDVSAWLEQADVLDVHAPQQRQAMAKKAYCLGDE